MTHHTQLEDKLGGADGSGVKVSHNRSMAKAKRIVADSIKDHLIPHVSAFKTPKEVYGSLTKMFKGKNINQKMTLRNQLKNVRIYRTRRLYIITSQGLLK